MSGVNAASEELDGAVLASSLLSLLGVFGTVGGCSGPGGGIKDGRMLESLVPEVGFLEVDLLLSRREGA